jgi:phosphatidate phosphatase
MRADARTCCARSDVFDAPGFASLCTDVALLGAVSLLSWLRPQWVPPGDALSSYPSAASTVSNAALVAYTAGAYAAALCLLAYAGRHIAGAVRAFNPWAATWLWGSELALTGALSQFFKYFVGRPRPALYAECGPDAQFATCAALAGAARDDQFMAWPSGHATFAFGGFLYTALFVAAAIDTDVSWVATLAVLLAAVAFWIGTTRISDYKHHPDDVTAGFFIAALVTALLWYRGWKRVFPRTVPSACGQREEI